MLDRLFSNRFMQIAFAIATIGGLLSDQFGYGYLGVLAVVTIFLLIALFDEYKRKKVYSAKNIPLPLVINISNPADSHTALNSIFEILSNNYPNHQKNLKEYFNIIEKDLIFKYDGDIFDEERFIDFLKITKHQIKKLDAQTLKNVHFHLVYIGPIANAILIGTIFGTEGITLYQYSKSTDSYTVALDIDSRSYKEHVDLNDFRILKKEIIGEIKDKATIAIDLASHKVALSKLEKPIIHLSSKVGATLKNKEDFIRANQEIYAVINELQQSVSQIKLVYSMPTTVAILLGMSIQNYWDIELTQFGDGEYKSVIKHLNRIKYYF